MLDAEKLLWIPGAKKIFIPGSIPAGQIFLWMNLFVPETIDGKYFLETKEQRDTWEKTAAHQLAGVISDKQVPQGTVLWKSSDGFSVYPEPRLDCERFGRVA